MTDIPIPQEVTFNEQIEEGILEYTLFVSENRAIPSMLDGLKPVQRRLLYQAYLDKLVPVSMGGKHQKSIKLVGNTLGNFHPHGDTACYGGLVTAASKSTARNPLFDDFQGNWGDPSMNDGAAAMRYTEVTMSELGHALVADAEFLDMVPNFDGTNMEPYALCPPIPAVLINDNIGIASGMDTSIPSHNIANVCDAALAFIKNNNCRDQTLLDAIQGPDHVAGGVLMDYEENRQGLRDLYLDGSGSLWFSLKWTIEPSSHADWKHMVKITSLAPELKGHDLIYDGRFNALITSGDCHLEDLCEGSQAMDLRLHYNNPNVAIKGILPQLRDYKITYRLNVLDYDENDDRTLGKKVPVNCTLRYMLSRWLTYRREVVTRRLTHHIAASEWRLKQLQIQRFLATHQKERDLLFKCGSDDEAFALLSPFGFNAEQSRYGFGLSIRSLSRMNEDALIKSLDNEQAKLDAFIAQANDLDGTIALEVKDMKKRFGQDERRVELFGTCPEPELVKEGVLAVAGSDWGLSVNGSWPAQGKGLGKSFCASFAYDSITVLLETGKILTQGTYDWVGFNSYIFGVATEADEYLAILDDQGDVYIRNVPEGGFLKSVKVCKGYPVAMVGLKSTDSLLIQLGDNVHFQYMSAKSLADANNEGIKVALSTWWDETKTGTSLIKVPAGADVVDGQGNQINLIGVVPDEDLFCGAPARVIGKRNLVTYASGRASMLSYDEVYNTLGTVADCYPVEGTFGTEG